MYLKGQLSATSDINVVNAGLSQGVRVIYLGDPAFVDPQYKDFFITATALTPDYQTMALQVDGNQRAFIEMYVASLNAKPALEMLSAIFACLFNGINVLFYIPQEAVGLNYITYLLDFIKLNYGVHTQTKSTQGGFDEKFTNKFMSFLYLYNLVKAHEFLLHSDSMDDMTLKKLVCELHPMVRNPKDINEIVQWFNNYKDQLIAAQQPLVNGIQYAGEVSEYGCF